MPKQTQAKVSSELDKAAEDFAAARAKVADLTAQRVEAEAKVEQLRGDVQTAQMELDRAHSALLKVASGTS